MRRQNTSTGGMRLDNRFLKREYLKVLFPVMFSVLGGTVNALIDSVFVSRLVGPAGLSAVNQSMPLYLFLCMAGSLIGCGASILSARAAGKENIKEASDLYHAALAFGAIVSVAASAAGLLLLNPLSGLLSGGGETAAYVRTYCGVTIGGSAAFILPYIPLYYLQLEGKRRQIAVMIAIMVATDVLADFLLMGVWKLEILGAALASVLAMVLSCGYGFFSLQRGYSNYRFRFRSLNLRSLPSVFRYGSPAALGNLYDAVKLLVVNAIVLSAAGSDGMAVWAVLNTLSELSMMVVNGIPRAGSAMLSVYSASRENGGIRMLVRMEFVIGTALSLGFAGLLVALAEPIRLMYRLPVSMVIPLLCLGSGVLLSTWCCILETFFTASGRIAVSNIFVALRRVVFPVLAALAVAGLDWAVWLFLPIGGAAALASFLLIVFAISRVSARTERPLSGILLLDDILERENKVLDFSIPPDTAEVCSAAERLVDFCRMNQMDAKLAMKLSLSIEELLTVMIRKCSGLISVDLRVYVLDGTTGIRIRCSGKNYNPFTDTESDEDFLMGIHMMQKLSDIATHSYTLGVNTLNLIFEGETNGNQPSSK